MKSFNFFCEVKYPDTSKTEAFGATVEAKTQVDAMIAGLHALKRTMQRITKKHPRAAGYTVSKIGAQ